MGENLLARVQAEQAQWAAHNFGKRPAYQALLGVVEEVGELSHAHLKGAQGIRTNEDHEEAGRDAVGDILIYLLDYCTRRGWDVCEILDITWNEVRRRDWIAYPETGRPNV